jgi:CubicO group peptidase (beta-lactamase class C family)
MIARAPQRCVGAGLLAAAVFSSSPAHASAQTHWPASNATWERRAPEEMGFDPARLQAAVQFSIASESASPRDLELNHQMTFGREPHGEAVGPFSDRGPQTGLIVKDGYIVAEWGDPARVDQTFSVAKTFLSTTAGLAYDRGLIRSLGDLVRDYMPPIVLADGDGEPGDQGGRRPKLLFESEQNRKITWDHLLRQTSDWEGTLWGKPEWADRPSQDATTWVTRARNEPGTVFEYNDTRVNLLALALTAVWRRPLADVLHEHVMGPIGASTTWQWHGYDNSWINMNGHQVQVVSGGSHWGGGMFINAYDQARLGLLALHRGVWNGERIVSEEWIRTSTTPGAANDAYGFMNYYLNAGDAGYENAPEASWQFLGAGSNVVYVDPVNDLVIVSRWIRGNRMNELVGMVLDAMVGTSGP